MQKVIKNKRYNTETAVTCGSVGTTTLYQKRTGEFFLADTTTKILTPISYENAELWVKENGIQGAEKYFQFKPGKTVTTFSLTFKTIEQIKRIAQERGVSASEVISELVADAYIKG